MKGAFKCLLAVLVLLPQLTHAQNAYARKGLLDLRSWNFEEGAVNLTGEWEFYMSELADAAALANEERRQKEYIDFPATWNEFNQARNPGEGYATYRLRAIVQSPQEMALELPHFYSNYSLWLNGEILAFNGMVGTSPKTSVPHWQPQTVTFKAGTDTLDIVIHVSNFHHAKGGIREPILLGEVSSMVFKRQVAISSSVIMFCLLLIIAATFIILFLFSKKQTSMIYFAAICITWAIRSMFSNLYPGVLFLPSLPWEIYVKIEYLTLYFMMMWCVFFLASIFRNDVSTTFKYFMCLCNGIFVFVTLYFDASLYTQFLPVYLSFITILIVYVIFVLIRAIVAERQGVWLIVTCFFLGVVLFSYDIIAYQGFATFNPIILNAGYMTMFLLTTTALLMDAGYLKRPVNRGSMLTYEELFGKTGEAKR